MNSSANNFSAEDYNYINSNETTDNINSNRTIVSTELNTDSNSFADMISNFHRIKNYKNNSLNTEQFRSEEFDKNLSNIEIQYDKYDCQNEDLNYKILDLDSLEYITYKSKENFVSNLDIHSDIQYFLYEHNYCIRKEATPTCEEILDTSKLRDSDKNELNSFTDEQSFNGEDYVGKLEDSPQFYGKEYNLQEFNEESYNFEIIPNNLSTDNISIYTISDDEQKSYDLEVPELDVISISSTSSIEDRFDVIHESDTDSCGYHSSDFEFIEEHEAKKIGLIINYNPQSIRNNKVNTIEIDKEYNSRQLILDYFNIPAVSNNIEYKIPQVKNYINMFERNIPYPVTYMENKSIYTNECTMNTDYQDLGFNTSLYSREKVDKNVQKEADESRNKIMLMYPSENRRMRKRRRT